jgi:hypothetical protein
VSSSQKANSSTMPVLSAEDLAFFEENGYVVAKGAISRDQAAATAAEVWDFTGMDADDPSTWCEWAHCISLPAPLRPAVCGAVLADALSTALWPTGNCILCWLLC